MHAGMYNACEELRKTVGPEGRGEGICTEWPWRRRASGARMLSPLSMRGSRRIVPQRSLGITTGKGSPLFRGMGLYKSTVHTPLCGYVTVVD